ncbi:MAG: competence protein ComEC, partial [Parcubacteria group bacterium Greene1014_47]
QEVLKGNALSVSFFGVGQGDASFIETPQRKQILIDGGPDATVLEKLGKVMPFWDRSIDLVILSHPAQDHVAGLLDVLKAYKVQNILWTGIEKETLVFKQWKEILAREQEEGARIFLAYAGQRLNLGENAPCPQRIDVLYPDSIAGTLVKGDDNDTSIVARLEFCGSSILFTGDLTKKGEKILLSQKASVDSDILKVGHHGSKTSSSAQFVEAVSPEVAVISAGRGNRYGHPNLETLETLARYGIEIRRTDEEGDIVFRFQ